MQRPRPSQVGNRTEQFCEFSHTNPVAMTAGSGTSTSHNSWSSSSVTRTLSLRTGDSSTAQVASSLRKNSAATARTPRSGSRPCRPPFSRLPSIRTPGSPCATARAGAVPTGARTVSCLSGAWLVSDRLRGKGICSAIGRAWQGGRRSLLRLRRG